MLISLGLNPCKEPYGWMAFLVQDVSSVKNSF